VATPTESTLLWAVVRLRLRARLRARLRLRLRLREI
jgi:hypothetical protein